MLSKVRAWMSLLQTRLRLLLGGAPLPMAVNPQLRHTAYHEAGHALVAHLFGRPCQLVTIEPNGWILGYVVPDRFPVVSVGTNLGRRAQAELTARMHRNVAAQVLVYLAGMTAEAVSENIDVWTYLRKVDKQGSSDWDAAEYHLKLLWYLLTDRTEQLGDMDRSNAASTALRLTQRLLAQHRVALDALADRLLRERTLIERQVFRVIERHVPRSQRAASIDPRSLFRPAVDA